MAPYCKMSLFITEPGIITFNDFQAFYDEELKYLKINLKTIERIFFSIAEIYAINDVNTQAIDWNGFLTLLEKISKLMYQHDASLRGKSPILMLDALLKVLFFI